MELTNKQTNKLNLLINTLKRNSRMLGRQHNNNSVLGSELIVINFNNKVDLSDVISKSKFKGDFIEVCESTRNRSDEQHQFDISYNDMLQAIKGRVKKSNLVKIDILNGTAEISIRDDGKTFKVISVIKLDQVVKTDNLSVCFNTELLKRTLELMHALSNNKRELVFNFDMTSNIRPVKITSDNLTAYLMPVRLY